MLLTVEVDTENNDPTCTCDTTDKQKCPIHKVCLRCGHEPCPHCGDWCDVILYSDEDEGFRPEGWNTYDDGKIDDEPYPFWCCDGECVYE